jgi:6-phosphogluconolactonase
MGEAKYVAYVGTYTHGNSVGIHIFDINPEKWNMVERKVVPINNPSDLIVSNSGKYLYSISDQGVQSFRILPDGDLEPMNGAWTGGMRGCYLDVDDEDRFLFVAGYHDGRVTMMYLNEDGTIGDIADGIFHKGFGINMADRSSMPHVTCVKVAPNQKTICAVDSGLDQIKNYHIDYEKGKLELEDIIRCELDSGPRMIRFDHQNKFAYVLCEIEKAIYVYDVKTIEEVQEIYEPLQKISTIEESDDDHSAASGIEFSPDGKHLFVSNAGINSVTIYEVNQKTGMLTKVFSCKTSGDYPKTIDVMPDNQHFVVLSHETNEIFIYKMNYEKNYFLQDTKPISIEQPNCIYIHKLKEV